VSFLVQFLRFRRSVPEVVRTLHLQQAATEAEALEIAKGRIGPGSWPVRINALRVMDDGGRTLIDWLVPEDPPSPHVDTVSQAAQHRMVAREPSSAASSPGHTDTAGVDPQHLEIGQPVAYASDARPDAWKGGFDILGRTGINDAKRYRIRSADEKSDRDVWGHNLREDLGARTRGQ
jgi:hypothetical protein